jgi:hypothetical protein
MKRYTLSDVWGAEEDGEGEFVRYSDLAALATHWKRRAAKHEAKGDAFSIVFADAMDICADELFNE